MGGISRDGQQSATLSTRNGALDIAKEPEFGLGSRRLIRNTRDMSAGYRILLLAC